MCEWILWCCRLCVVSVWCRGAVRREERRSDRQDVRLSPGSFLQLFPAEVLMSLAGYECSVEIGVGKEKKLSLDSFVINVILFFYDAAEEQVRWTPEHFKSILKINRRWCYKVPSCRVIAAHIKATSTLQQVLPAILSWLIGLGASKPFVLNLNCSVSDECLCMTHDKIINCGSSCFVKQWSGSFFFHRRQLGYISFFKDDVKGAQSIFE